VNPFEEEHEKFIELEAEVIHLKDANDKLQHANDTLHQALQQAGQETDQLKQIAAD
jgi:hypothetical protein